MFLSMWGRIAACGGLVTRQPHKCTLSPSPHIYFSSMVITRPPATFSSVCTVPLGHVTVNLSTAAALPNPKWTRERLYGPARLSQAQDRGPRILDRHRSLSLVRLSLYRTKSLATRGQQQGSPQTVGPGCDRIFSGLRLDQHHALSRIRNCSSW